MAHGFWKIHQIRNHLLYSSMTRNTSIIDKNLLIKFYTVEGKTVKELQEIFYCSKSKVERLLKGIKRPKKFRQLQTQKTCREKYGVDNISQLQTTKDKVKKTCEERYGKDKMIGSKDFRDRTAKVLGVENASQLESVKEKVRHTVKERYGVENISQLQETKEKVKTTCKEKYGTDYFTQTQDYTVKSAITCQEKYGVNNYSQSKQFKELYTNEDFVKDLVHKMHETKKRNGSYGKSKEEDRLYKKIKSKYPDVIRQYSDYRYPFLCDFYIPSLDLFIEYQGHIRHGKEPFNPENPEHIKRMNFLISKANTSKYYKDMLKCWTILDPEKRRIAKENNLRLKEVWKF